MVPAVGVAKLQGGAEAVVPTVGVAKLRAGQRPWYPLWAWPSYRAGQRQDALTLLRTSLGCR